MTAAHAALATHEAGLPVPDPTSAASPPTDPVGAAANGDAPCTQRRVGLFIGSYGNFNRVRDELEPL
jgi:hypothetical protein